MTEMLKKPTVLFVDDEPFVLQGLRRMLRTMRKTWDMEFLEGGQAAMDRMRDGTFDAIVCDMRMPNVDGAQVLTEASKRNPESIRFILSGYAEQEVLLHALGPAHRLLSKPASAEDVVGSLENAFALRDLLPSTALRQLVSSLPSVPVPSDRYFELLRELDDPLSSAHTIGDAIEGDLGLTTQVLRLANSAFFSLPRQMSRGREAVEMLGIDMVRALLTVSEFYLSNLHDPVLADEGRNLAERSLSIGALARRLALAEELPEEVVEASATAGMLCHIGTAILRQNMLAEFNRAVSLVEEGTLKMTDAEKQQFGATHAELAAFLVGIWGFSDDVVEAIAFHHAPGQSRSETLGALTMVHVAQGIVGETMQSGLFQREGAGRDLDHTYLERVGGPGLLTRLRGHVLNLGSG